MNLKDLLGLVKDALFPDDLTCDLCGRETFGTNICEQCLKTLIFNDKSTCPVCGRRTIRPEICAECKALPPKFERGVSVFVYEGGAAALIKKFKTGSAYLKEYFAETLCEKLKDFPKFDCIASVPMTRRAKSKRGYNQSELLANALSKRLNIPALRGAIVKTKETPEQKTLNRAERSKNLQRCFSVPKPDKIKGKHVLLVDDVLTTGATSDAVAAVLIKAGAEKVYFAAVASVEYKIIKTQTS